MEGNLVIDGNQLCHKLYYSSLREGKKTGWVYGSQYPEFRATLVRFFQALKDAKVTPTVVFDGILHLNEKKEVVLERHKQNARVYDRQRTSSTPVSHIGLPPLVYQAFNAILQELGVTQLVADGDGDVAIAHTANTLNCPVLSEDSDFYMFNIPRGYIHLDTFMRELDKPPRQIRTWVFHISDFIKQFGLPTDNSLHLVIPAIKGCDYLRRLPEVDECIPLCTADDNRMKRLITYLKQFKSFEGFLASMPQVNGAHEKLRENYDKAVKLYGNTAVGDSNTLVVGHSLPQWLADRYHCGNIIHYLLQARLLGYQLPASSATSKLLRQYAYGILGAPSVKEYPACDGTVKEVSVEAMDSIQRDPSQLLPKLAEVEILSLESRKQLMCQMLACNNGVIETLEEKWKLVIASVIFWATVEPRTEGLLKALIGCFVLCSSQSVERLREIHFQIRRHEREIHGQIRRHERENWQAHHSTFATWQCTYIAAVSLNQLLMEPLQSTSAACLFDSKLATSLVAEPNIDCTMQNLGISCDLYHSLLRTVQTALHSGWRTVMHNPRRVPPTHSHRARPEASRDARHGSASQRQNEADCTPRNRFELPSNDCGD